MAKLKRRTYTTEFRAATLGAPSVFVLRLASLQRPKGANHIRYFGVFGSASPLRSRVVKGGRKTGENDSAAWGVDGARNPRRAGDLRTSDSTRPTA